MALLEQRDALLRRPDLRGGAFASAWCAEVDEWLQHLFASVTEHVATTGVALIAVGGYGRGELAPGSDLDLLLAHRAKVPPGELAEQLWYPIWDEGLKLGHSVRTVAEALELAVDDLDTATSLLTMRHLAGDESLTDEIAAAARAQWTKRSKRYLGLLRENVLSRQSKFGEVAFLLEPDLKEGRGGLRDIHALRWAETARPVLQDGDLERLDAAEELLFDCRVALQRVTGGNGNRLSLQDQDAVGAALGTDADGLMAQVATAARTVAWIADEAWDRVAASSSTGLSLLGWRSRDRAPGLVVREGQVFLEPNVDPASRPDLILEAAALAARKGARLARDTHARLARAPLPPEVWPRSTRERFVELLACGRDAILVIESLDHTNLWENYLPEWEVVRNRPQRNAYHRFTVDRHLIEATANAAALTDRVARPDLLLIGALLHDIGKGRPGDHTEVGMVLVDEIGRRMGFPDADVAVLVDLVRLHLLLPDIAIRRDLSDDATIAAVAEAVGDRQRLELLAALTEADSLATGAAAWGTWKAELVRELVHRTDHFLAGGDLSALVTTDFPDEDQRALLAAGDTVVRGHGDTLVVVAPDRPGLFSRVAGALALQGLEVLSADAAGEDGMAIESIRVTSKAGGMVAWDRVTDRVHAALEGRLAIEARLAERVKTYARPNAARSVTPPTVTFDDAASRVATVVEVHAPDFIGLLYRVTRAFAEFDLDVRVAKVQTLGDMVVDAFYVTDSSGGLVTDPQVRAELERALLHAVA